jgi:hypothetical protein
VGTDRQRTDLQGTPPRIGIAEALTRLGFRLNGELEWRKVETNVLHAALAATEIGGSIEIVGAAATHTNSATAEKYLECSADVVSRDRRLAISIFSENAEIPSSERRAIGQELIEDLQEKFFSYFSSVESINSYLQTHISGAVVNDSVSGNRPQPSSISFEVVQLNSRQIIVKQSPPKERS